MGQGWYWFAAGTVVSTQRHRGCSAGKQAEGGCAAGFVGNAAVARAQRTSSYSSPASGSIQDTVYAVVGGTGERASGSEGAPRVDGGCHRRCKTRAHTNAARRDAAAAGPEAGNQSARQRCLGRSHVGQRQSRTQVTNQSRASRRSWQHVVDGWQQAAARAPPTTEAIKSRGHPPPTKRTGVRAHVLGRDEFGGHAGACVHGGGVTSRDTGEWRLRGARSAR